MSSPKVITITNPVQLLLAQLHEIRAGNTETRKEIERLTKLLRRGQQEEARFEAKLNKLLHEQRKKRTVKQDDGVGTYPRVGR